MLAKPLRISFDKIDRFIKIYDGTRYLILLSPERYDAIYDRIGYVVSEKSEKVILNIVLIKILQESN